MNKITKILLASTITLLLVAISLVVSIDFIAQANNCGVAGTYPGYTLVAEGFVSGVCSSGICYPPPTNITGLPPGNYIIEARGTYGTGGSYESDAEFVRKDANSPWSDLVPGYEDDPLGEGLDELWVDDTNVEWSGGVFQADHVYTLPWTVSGDSISFQLKDWYASNNSGGLCVALFIETIAVDIDIKPGSDPNCFNSNGHGVIPVAILSSPDFDASTVDPFTVTLNSAAVRVKGKSGNAGALEDVNGDGLDDLVVQIYDDNAYDTGDTVAILKGLTYDGVPFVGSDSICITQD